MMTNDDDHVLVLGIGNLLMGDEGIGVRVVQDLARSPLPCGVECMDGGTGSFLLLEALQQARRVILIDATVDGNAAGTVRRLRPRFSSEYPRTLTAHDIGLKDLLDVAYVTGGELDVVLLAVSIAPLQGVGVELSPEIEQSVPRIVEIVWEELAAAAVSN